MAARNPTVRDPRGLPGSHEGACGDHSAPARSLSAVALVTGLYGLVVLLTLAYEFSAGALTP